MGTPGPQELNSSEERVASVFGNYRAEWLEDKIFKFFQRPRYLSELESVTPVVLEGGRGTGKTTVLRCMEYRGQFSIRKLAGSDLSRMPYWGIYYRVDTSRVRAFDGPELDAQQWTRTYSHYANLILSEKLLQMALWTAATRGSDLSVAGLPEAAAAMGANTAASWQELHEDARRRLVKLEHYVNNVGSDIPPDLTMARAPVEAIAKALSKIEPFAGKTIFILLDEYENLLDYQQKVWNTFIKHSEPPLSYKIGVRPGGRRVRTTLSDQEHLKSPEDFALVDIAHSLGDEFDRFARRVCEERLEFIAGDDQSAIRKLDILLPGLSLDDEARRLGADQHAKIVRETLSSAQSIPSKWLKERSDLECVLLKYWSESTGEALESLAREYLARPADWERRLENYSFPVLFYINAGRKGGVLRKFYCGTETYGTLAHNNIRYYLELVSKAIVLHVRNSKSLSTPIDPKIQTRAALEIGEKNLAQLEGLSRLGGSVKKLLLSLGRILQVMAHSPIGHTPESTCFIISEALGTRHHQLQQVLDEATAHLALLKLPATKPTGVGDTKDDEYMLHTIFAPYFEISYRRKRHFTIGPDDLASLFVKPKRTIAKILATQGRTDSTPLPQQMTFFESFLASDD